MDRLFGNFIEEGFDMRLPLFLRRDGKEAMDKRADIDGFWAGCVDGAQDKIDAFRSLARILECFTRFVPKRLDVLGEGRGYLHLNPIDFALRTLPLPVAADPL